VPQLTKAMEGVKRLEMQPRGTQRRTGRGMLAQPSWEQERAVSAPAVRPVGVPARGWPGSAEPYKRHPREVGESGAAVGAVHSVPRKRGNARGWEGAALGLRVRGR
jgi:hypothetical protein